MRCPSCGFISFDHLAACKKCGKEFPLPAGGRRMPAPVPVPGFEPVGRPEPGPAAASEAVDTAAGPASAEETFSFTLPPAAGAGPEAAFAPAGFWIRFVATIADSIVLTVLMLVVLVPLGISAGIMGALADPAAMPQALVSLGAAITAVSVLIPLLYEVIFVGWRGQTPGKILLKLKIIRTDGGEVDYVKAFIRWIGKLVSGFILAIGYMMAAFTTNKRALHDYIAGTRVVRL